MLTIFFTVFIDLIGFGIIIPLSPYLARQFSATPFEVGLLMAVYSLAQFLFAPFWGGLSDKIGRRPIILVSVLGASLSHLAFAYSTTLPMLFISRTIAGFFGANISTAMAYMADVSDKKSRTKAMGVIGAAFGLGFILGPFIGALAGEWGTRLGNAPPFGHSFAAIVASGICFLGFLFTLFLLKESLEPQKRSNKIKLKSNRFKKIISSLNRPVLGKVQWFYFIHIFAMSIMEASLFLYVQDKFNWGLMKAGFGFAYLGLIMAFVQGYLIRKVLNNVSEIVMLRIGLAFLVLSYAGIAISHSVLILGISVTLLAFGAGFVSPAFSGIISLLAGEKEQGQVFGVNQSLAAMGRVLGPSLGGAVYGAWFKASPFLISMWLYSLLFLLYVRMEAKINQQIKK